MSERPGRYQRSFSGMVGALVILLVVVGAFVAFRSLVRDDPADPVKPVDFKGPAEFARTVAKFPLLAPDRLPKGWIATSVSFENVEEQSWHLGTLTDERHYVGLEQSRSPVGDMVDEFVDEDAVQGDDVTIDGRSWQSWSDAGGDLALVRKDPKVTTLVVGPVPVATLEELIATLR